LLTDLETEYKVNGRDTLNDLRGRLRLHIRPYFGGRRAAAITTANIRHFISKRQEDGASNGEINRELSAIKRAYNLAIQGGKLMHRPYIPMLKENNVRKGFFERDQFESVRRHLPPHVRPAITFAYITGWRIRSEVLSLRWVRVDSEAEVVRLEAGTAKNEDPREFPFTDELKALLEEQGRKADALVQERGIVTEHVFFRDEDGRPIRDFRKAWRRACKEAGLADEEEIGKTQKGKPIMKIKPLRIPHDFRRTQFGISSAPAFMNGSRCK
jgi:integrase